MPPNHAEHENAHGVRQGRGAGENENSGPVDVQGGEGAWPHG